MSTELKVLETSVLHASDILYWLDGTTAETIADMQRLAQPLHFNISNKPSKVQIRQAPGKTVFWRKSATKIIDGHASEEDKTFTDAGSFLLEGIVYDQKKMYNPRTFSVTLGASSIHISGQGMVMYPTPQGTTFGKAGGLMASLRFIGDERVVPWALISAVVTIPGIGSQTYLAQTDQHGDVLLPLHRLPPLPEGITEYSVALSVKALLTASPSTPLDTNDLASVDVESPTASGTFSTPITFSIVPGEIQVIRSANKVYLAVQAS